MEKVRFPLWYVKTPHKSPDDLHRVSEYGFKAQSIYDENWPICPSWTN
jgi:hypothetical protein